MLCYIFILVDRKGRTQLRVLVISQMLNLQCSCRPTKARKTWYHSFRAFLLHILGSGHKKKLVIKSTVGGLCIRIIKVVHLPHLTISRYVKTMHSK